VQAVQAARVERLAALVELAVPGLAERLAAEGLGAQAERVVAVASAVPAVEGLAAGPEEAVGSADLRSVAFLDRS
jgi:hypothetical protein